MTTPLVLLFYERILPGGQLLHRLQDLGYGVEALNDPLQLLPQSLIVKPLLVMVDCALKTDLVRQAVTSLRANPLTNHIPVIAYAPAQDPESLSPDTNVGATLLVTDNALILHLDQILDQALEIH